MIAVVYKGSPLDDLFSGDSGDLRSRVAELLGETWLSSANVHLRMRRPGELIGTDEECLVRDLLRSLAVSALS